MKAEEWRDIPGYEGMYQVSDQGRVKGLNRKDSRGRFRAERVLKPLKQFKGYIHIHLHKDGKCKTVKIHRLVAAAFLSDYCEKKQVDHRNRIRSCNKLSNLRMATNGENKENMKKIEGTSSKYKGVHWHKASKKWCSYIKKEGKGIHLGSFDKELDAAKAYDKKALEIFGEFANTNDKMGLLNESLG